MFDHLGALVSRHWVLVLLGWAVLVAGIHLLAPRWDDVTHDGDFAYLPERMTSVQGGRLLRAAFPDIPFKSKVALVVSRGDGRLTGPDFEVAERLIREFTPREGEDSPVVDLRSYDSPVIGKKLISRVGPNGQAALIVLLLRNEFMAIENMKLMPRIERELAAIRAEEDFPKGLRLGITGSAAVGTDMLFSAKRSIDNTERTAILLVVIILMLVYRAPGLVIVPLTTIVVSVFVATDLVAILAQLSGRLEWLDFKVFKTTRIFIIVILFGAGTDYCLFLISRYREELRHGLAPPRAIAVALGRVGDALAASALTTICGLGMMFFAEFGKFSNSGPAIALCLAVALAASVTLAPALLRATGRVVFWPLGELTTEARRTRRKIISELTTEAQRTRREIKQNHELEDQAGTPARELAASRFSGSLLLRLLRALRASVVSIFSCLLRVLRASVVSTSGGFWQWLSRRIIARPGLILLLSILLLAPLAYEGFSVPITYDLLGELRADLPSVQGTHLLRRHFSPAEIDPITLLAYDPKAELLTAQGQREIALLTKDLYDFRYVDSFGRQTNPITSVRSLSEPLGNPPGSFNLFSRSIREKIYVLKNPRTKAIYRSQASGYAGKVARFDLISQYDPFSKENVRLLDHVQQHLSAEAEDPSSDWHGVKFVFLGTTAGIRDLESVTTSDQLRIQVLVVAAVLFVLVLILRRPGICVYLILSVLFGYFVTIGITEVFFRWLYGDTFHGLDWKVPIFLFVLLIALGEDYNIYLTTRVFEEQRRLGPLEGLRVALVRTGGIITSCGVIMAGTFASMTTGTLRAMHELGFALSLGVLLDTFIIRTILVPAFLALLARRSKKGVRTLFPSPGSEWHSVGLEKEF